MKRPEASAVFKDARLLGRKVTLESGGNAAGVGRIDPRRCRRPSVVSSAKCELVAFGGRSEVSADLADAEEAQDLRNLAASVEEAVEHNAEMSWDSAERRELHVEGITAGPDQAGAATAWKQADVDQARHPREALQGGRKGKSSRTRVPAATPDRQIGREGR